jgi:hypothetical protein
MESRDAAPMRFAMRATPHAHAVSKIEMQTSR